MILTFRHKKYRTFHEQHEMNGSFNGRNVHCAVETKLFYINVLFFVPRIVIQLCTFFFFVGQRLFFHSLGRGSCVETFFPSFLWSEILHLSIFLKSVEYIQVSLKSDTNKWHFTVRPVYTSRTVLHIMRKVSEKVAEKIKTHFMFNKIFSGNGAVYEIMWKNMLELERPHMTT